MEKVFRDTLLHSFLHLITFTTFSDHVTKGVTLFVHCKQMYNHTRDKLTSSWKPCRFYLHQYRKYNYHIAILFKRQFHVKLTSKIFIHSVA